MQDYTLKCKQIHLFYGAVKGKFSDSIPTDLFKHFEMKALPMVITTFEIFMRVHDLRFLQDFIIPKQIMILLLINYYKLDRKHERHIKLKLIISY